MIILYRPTILRPHFKHNPQPVWPLPSLIGPRQYLIVSQRVKKTILAVAKDVE